MYFLQYRKTLTSVQNTLDVVPRPTDSHASADLNGQCFRELECLILMLLDKKSECLLKLKDIPTNGDWRNHRKEGPTQYGPNLKQELDIIF